MLCCVALSFFLLLAAPPVTVPGPRRAFEFAETGIDQGQSRGKEVENAMRGYELTFVARPTLDEDGMVALTEKVTSALTALGATVENVKRWGRRRLAYAIKRYVEGIYVLITMDIDTTALPELERTLKLNEDIIRYLIVRPPD